MRVALLHDYLNQLGGGERVLDTMMEMFPEAPIYTLFHDAKKTLNRYAGRVKETSFLDLPMARDNHRLFIPLMPIATNTMAVKDHFDVVISDSAGYAKGFHIDSHISRLASNTERQCKHIAYIHTPLRYAWEGGDYIALKFKNQNSKIKIFVDFLLKPVMNYLKKWDYKTAQKPDILIANSKFIAEKIKKYYDRDAEVIYPPVDTSKFFFQPPTSHIPHPTSYYLAVGRLLHYKRFDLMIRAFAKLGLPLRIVGSGPNEIKLRLLAHKLNASNIRFWPHATDNDLQNLYNSAEALIFPQVEDFGLVAAEAQMCGCPVIAYRAGGALEIIKDKKTGVFFDAQTPEAIITAVNHFEKNTWDRKKIAESAQRFSKENFKISLAKMIEKTCG